MRADLLTKQWRLVVMRGEALIEFLLCARSWTGVILTAKERSQSLL